MTGTRGEYHSLDEALDMIREFIVEQQATELQGERLISVNLDSAGRITSVKAADKTPKCRRLEPRA